MAIADRRGLAEPVPDMTGLGEVLEFMRAIWQLDHALQRTSKIMEKSLGVTGPQRLVIRIVGRFPDILAGQLATLLHLHPSTLTGILQRLEDQGLLERHVDPGDARRSLLRLTRKGRFFDVASEGTVEDCVARTVRHARPGQVALVKGMLVELAEQLTAACEAPASKPISRKKTVRR